MLQGGTLLCSCQEGVSRSFIQKATKVQHHITPGTEGTSLRRWVQPVCCCHEKSANGIYACYDVWLCQFGAATQTGILFTCGEARTDLQLLHTSSQAALSYKFRDWKMRQCSSVDSDPQKQADFAF